MAESTVEQVRSKYAAVAQSGQSGDQTGVRAVAEAFGYTPEELASIPAEANLGVSCGNPTATASLRPGEVVVDLGSGGGIDVLLAAKKVGPTGRAIGIDMTDAMVQRARTNAAKSGAGNAEFHLGRIEALPLPDATADCVISNCVLNLVPDKAAAFREIVRVLKPGGRLAVSDIALKSELPDELANSVAAYVGCVAGAIPIAEYERLLREAGFASVQVIDTGKDLNVYTKIEGQAGCCGSEPAAAESGCPPTDAFAGHNVNDYAASVRVYALKPTSAGESGPTRECCPSCDC